MEIMETTTSGFWFSSFGELIERRWSEKETKIKSIKIVDDFLWNEKWMNEKRPNEQTEWEFSF